MTRVSNAVSKLCYKDLSVALMSSICFSYSFGRPLCFQTLPPSSTPGMARVFLYSILLFQNMQSPQCFGGLGPQNAPPFSCTRPPPPPPPPPRSCPRTPPASAH